MADSPSINSRVPHGIEQGQMSVLPRYANAFTCPTIEGQNQQTLLFKVLKKQVKPLRSPCFFLYLFYQFFHYSHPTPPGVGFHLL